MALLQARSTGFSYSSAWRDWFHWMHSFSWNCCSFFLPLKRACWPSWTLWYSWVQLGQSRVHSGAYHGSKGLLWFYGVHLVISWRLHTVPQCSRLQSLESLLHSRSLMKLGLLQRPYWGSQAATFRIASLMRNPALLFLSELHPDVLWFPAADARGFPAWGSLGHLLFQMFSQLWSCFDSLGL